MTASVRRSRAEMVTAREVESRRLRRQVSRYAELAHRDGLTGLANRMPLDERSSQAVAEAGRTGERLAFLFLDLDGFKLIEELCGKGDVCGQGPRQVRCGSGQGIGQQKRLRLIHLPTVMESAREALVARYDACGPPSRYRPGRDFNRRVVGHCLRLRLW
jgi:hypothetical protein